MSTNQSVRVIDINTLINEIQQLRAKQEELIEIIKNKDLQIAQLTEKLTIYLSKNKDKTSPRPKLNKTLSNKDFPQLPTKNRYEPLNEDSEMEDDSSSEASVYCIFSYKNATETLTKCVLVLVFKCKVRDNTLPHSTFVENSVLCGF